jgi:PAS domain-containing protein
VPISPLDPVTLSLLEIVANALPDGAILVNREQRIVQHNRVFAGWYPKPVARKLGGMTCKDALCLSICEQQGCIAQQCMELGRVRYDEVDARLAGTDEARKVIVSAGGIPDARGHIDHTLMIIRDVTDEANVQGKYQQMLETTARERAATQALLRERTARLIEVAQALADLRELAVELQRSG